MKKEDLHKALDDLGIKYQDNDTNDQLELMLNGYKAIEENKELKAELEKQNKEVENLSTEIGNLNEENHELQEQLEKQNEIIDKLNENVSDTDISKATGAPTVKVGDKHYVIPAPKASVPLRIADKLGVKELTVDAVKKDSKLAEKIVKMGLGFLVEVESNKK